MPSKTKAKPKKRRRPAGEPAPIDFDNPTFEDMDRLDDDTVDLGIKRRAPTLEELDNPRKFWD